MKFKTALLACGLLLGALQSALHAIPVHYSFVVTSGPAGGGTFSAQTSFDDSLFGAPASNTMPLTFTASLTGNSFTVDRTWSLSDVVFSQLVISSSGVLTFSALVAYDLSLPTSGYVLNGGATGFSAPTTIGGYWQKQAPVATPVPDVGFSWALPTLAGLLILAGRRFQKSRR
ncbi:MAG TPA: hypothetical protein PLN52_01905 [Opitutaceae bacterium]|nr:hypothetical protein [Opitutaceae bacterium]